MILYSSASALYVVQPASVLKCCKVAGKLSVSDFTAVGNMKDAVEVGEVHGVVGLLSIQQQRFLLLITQSSAVASFPCSREKIFHVDKICAVPVENNGTIDKVNLDGSLTQLEKMLAPQRKLMKFVTDKINSLSQIDEILRLFNDNGDFYVCFEKDLTLTTQRFHSGCPTDERFFWNRHLLCDLFDDSGAVLPDSAPWVTPICQGFITERILTLEVDSPLTLTLVSRRSVWRAGVRYLRRGIDDDANVANFVETEIILSIFGHQLSFVQVRGSVPLFWTQKGYRYRPPLFIDRPLNQSFPAFEKHVNELITEYGAPLVIVNLVDQTGRELGLAISYLEHVLEMNSPDICYFSFDFHFHCRALRFHKVDDLTSAMRDQLAKVAFCWVDKSGHMVRKQQGVVRTNCVDCLDRTNIVQGVISQAMCLTQCQKLGLVGPLCDAPDELMRALQSIWADNGDAVSRQYAGTDALKGDVTRSGQRKLTGIVRDGYNSASRYYLSHMRDAQRQLAIDTLLGYTSKINLREMNVNEECEIEEEESENIGRLVHETARFVVAENEVLVGGWALVDGCDHSDQIDTVLLLTRSRLIIAVYDDDSEKLLEVKLIGFEDITGIELGTFGKSSRLHLRLYARPSQQFSWRAARTRLFNNVAIPLKSDDEADEYVQAISEQIKVTVTMAGYDIGLQFVGKLSGQPEKKRPKFMSMVSSVFRMRSETLRLQRGMDVSDTPGTMESSGELNSCRVQPNTGLVTAPSVAPHDAPLIFFHVDPHDDQDEKYGAKKPTPQFLDDTELSTTQRNSTEFEALAQLGERNENLGLDQVCQIRPSKSDGGLVEKTGGLVSKLHRLKLPLSRSQIEMDEALPERVPLVADPFSNLRQKILSSNSLIMLL